MVEFEDLDNVCLLSITGPTLMLLLSFFIALLVTEEIILGLIRVNTVIVSFVLMTARYTILVYNSHALVVLFPRFQVVLYVGHEDLYGL